jgi:hypothetical protein
VHALGYFALCAIELKVVADMNALDHEHVVHGTDFSRRLRNETPVTCRNLTRLQRATEGARQSTSSRRHDVVKRGRVRLM